jgi:hypothetical protein
MTVIAAQSLVPVGSQPDVARLHGISRGQLYTWRHALKAAQPTAANQAIRRFARVEVAPRPVVPPDTPAQPPGLIEIALSDGTTVRIDAGIDPRDLGRGWRRCAEIVLPRGAHVWLACGYTDMRKGMDGLAMLGPAGAGGRPVQRRFARLSR